jgi:hypothetical protein
MSQADEYVNEIKSIYKEMKHLQKTMNMLREQVGEARIHLYTYMRNHNMEKYKGFSLKGLEPKPKIPRKPQKEKKKDALYLFEKSGIADPDNFWEELQKTQKYEIPELEDDD